MPDTTGKLTPEDQKKVSDWLREKWKTPANCPICGSTNWTIGDHLIQPLTFFGGGVSIGGITYPQVMVISNDCGYTRLFNAVMLGLLPQAPPTGEKKAE